MSKPRSNKVVINNKTTITIKDGKLTARRQRLRKKLKQTKRLRDGEARHRYDLPEAVDMDKMVQHGNYCIATYKNGLFVTHDPVVRFVRREDITSHRFRRHDFIYFDVKAWEIFGLQAGMQLALFTDREVNPRFLIIQNVTKEFDAPAHLHKQGMFTLHSNCVTGDGTKNHDHVCNPGTVTKRGYIRNPRRGWFELSLFHNYPELLGQWGRIYRVTGTKDLLVVPLAELRECPVVVAKKATRPDAGLIESDVRPYNAAKRCSRQVPGWRHVAAT